MTEHGTKLQSGWARGMKILVPARDVSREKKAQNSGSNAISDGFVKGLKANRSVSSSSETRPTGSKVRAAVLNMLQPRLSESSVLDLYAGSGAVALEMVSRGAVRATLVENSSTALAALKLNVAEILRRAEAQGMEKPDIVTVPGSVPDFLERQSSMSDSHNTRFDIIWADPPYRDVPGIIGMLHRTAAKLLAADGCLVIECGTAEEIDLTEVDRSQMDLDRRWETVKDKVYGVTRIIVRELNAGTIPEQGGDQ